MNDFIQLHVCVGNDSWLIPLSQNAKGDELFNIITERCAVRINPTKMRLLCGDKYLEYGNKNCLNDYNLVHLSTVVANLPVCGGVWPLQAIRDREINLVSLPGFITVTSSPTEPDMITLDESPDKKRARMPCGHVIGPDSMTTYCESVLSNGEFKFYCPSPKCNREWEYFLVRHVACLSSDQMKDIEKKITDNYLQKAKGYQTCPRCNTWCYKKNDTPNYVRCPLCNKSFCWACLRDWIRTSDSLSCGNSDCDGRDSQTRILANCPAKEIGGCKACPTMRACPNCGMLTAHIKDCAHVTCTSCKHGFCFICLKGKTSSGAWPCPPAGNCALAPRQTSTSWLAPTSPASTSPTSPASASPTSPASTSPTRPASTSPTSPASTSPTSPASTSPTSPASTSPTSQPESRWPCSIM